MTETSSAEETQAPDDEAAILRKGDLLDRIVERTGLKRKDAKIAMEATLEELGMALVVGEEMRLPPLGKMKVVRTKNAENADVYTCKLRRAHPAEEGEAETPEATE